MSGADIQPLIDLQAISDYLTAVVMYYEERAPTVSKWADELYRTLAEDPGKVTVRELLTAQALWEERHWEQPNLAANRIYKLQYAMGKDTTGQIGF